MLNSKLYFSNYVNYKVFKYYVLSFSLPEESLLS